MIFTRQKKIVFVFLFVAVLAALILLASDRPLGLWGEGMVCPGEVLVCPDGSAVGPVPPSCAFSPCPSNGFLEGEFRRDAQGSRLIVESPSGMGMGVTYAVPLFLEDIEIANDESGKTMKLIGRFVSGNTFKVERVEESSMSSIPGVHVGAISVGESKLLGGVRITLNAVVSDSRCPLDATCVWAGEITANVTLESDTDKETLDLSSGKLPHGFDAYQVSIVGAVPEMRTNVRIDPSKYQLTFKVEKQNN